GSGAGCPGTAGARAASEAPARAAAAWVAAETPGPCSRPALLQFVDLARELADVAELPVDRREPDVGHLIDPPQLLHDARADLGGLHLAIGAVLQLRLDAIGDAFELLHADGPLLARADESADQLLPLKRLRTPVLLDHAILDLLDVLAARVALAAAEALAPPPDAVAFLALARVDDLVAEVTAEGAFHAVFRSPSPPVFPSSARSRMRPSQRPSRAMNPRPRIVTGTNEMACSTIAAPTAVDSGSPRKVTTAIL